MMSKSFKRAYQHSSSYRRKAHAVFRELLANILTIHNKNKVETMTVNYYIGSERVTEQQMGKTGSIRRQSQLPFVPEGTFRKNEGQM